MKTPLQVLGLHVLPIFKYLSKYFSQTYRAQYEPPRWRTSAGHQHELIKQTFR